MKLEAGKTYVFKDDAARDEYLIYECNYWCFNEFYNNGFTLSEVSLGDGFIDGYYCIDSDNVGLFKESKPFDISKYEFSGNLVFSGDADNSIILDTQSESFISISEKDVEAMAKHFKLI